ncbi:MAG: TIGR00725 family protein [Candidatus Binataceae bacterium]
MNAASRAVIAVVGAGDAPVEVRRLAYELGFALASGGADLVCGGLGGVMEAAAEGARAAGGHTLGILPGGDRGGANRHIEFAVATGMSEARNLIVVRSADAVVALAGEFGTLSEIAFALKIGRPVIALRAWKEIDGLSRADTPAAAAALALEFARRPRA